MSRVYPWSALVCAAVLNCLSQASAHAQLASGPPGREVSLDALIAYARTHAPTLRVARERIRGSEDLQQAADRWLADNPELELSAGPRWGGGSSRLALDFSAGLSQPIEIAGNRSARLQAARRSTDRVTAAAALGAFELELELAAAYRAAQLARAQAELARTLVEFAAETRRIVQRRLAAGDASLIELRVAEGEAARAQRDQSLAGQALTSASLLLCELSGWPADSLPLPAAALPTQRDVPTLAQLLAWSASRHPALQLRRAELSEARAQTNVAERAAWPVPALGAQLAREGSLVGPAEWVILGTLRVSLPFWQQNQLERERGRAEQRLAQAEADTLLHTLGLRIQRARAELLAAAERLQLMAASSASFADSLALLKRGFEAGELALVDVSVARERFLETEVAGLSAQAEYEHAWIELERATGRSLGGTR